MGSRAKFYIKRDGKEKEPMQPVVTNMREIFGEGISTDDAGKTQNIMLRMFRSF